MKPVRRTAIGLLLLWALASCGGDADAAAGSSDGPRAPFQGPPVNLGGCATPKPPAPIPDGLPADIALPEGARSVEPPFDLPNGVQVELQVPGEVLPIQKFFIRSLKDEGRRIVATDYEGWEAEVYFAERDERPGLVQLVSACSGGTSVSIQIFDLDG